MVPTCSFRTCLGAICLCMYSKSASLAESHRPGLTLSTAVSESNGLIHNVQEVWGRRSICKTLAHRMQRVHMFLERNRLDGRMTCKASTKRAFTRSRMQLRHTFAKASG